MEDLQATRTMRDQSLVILNEIRSARTRLTDDRSTMGDVIELTDSVDELRILLSVAYDLRCQVLRQLQSQGVKVSEMVQATGVTKQAVHLMLAKGRRIDDAGRRDLEEAA
jgi:hypothetical protein